MPSSGVIAWKRFVDWSAQLPVSLQWKGKFIHQGLYNNTIDVKNVFLRFLLGLYYKKRVLTFFFYFPDVFIK